MDTEELLLSLAHQFTLSLVLITQLKKKMLASKRCMRKRQLWARKWLLRRNEGRGISNMVFEELRYKDPISFKNFTRMRVNTFEFLLLKVESSIQKQDTVLRKSISARTRLLLTLRFLATGESYRSLQYTFRISVPSISIIVPETVAAIYNELKDEYLSVPNTEDQWREISKQFYELWNFPNCLGAIDGKHIAFKARKEDGAFYFNYKGFHSIILMALVDANYNFIYVDVGCNGRASDGGVYLNSSLCSAVENNLLNFPNEDVLPRSNKKAPYVILSDDAFRLTKRMMKPFGQSSLTDQKIFNYRLSRARRVVENAFGILANKFQVLQREINLSVDKVHNVTLVCCVLHNFIKKCEGKVYLAGMDIENTENVTLTTGGWRNEVFTTPLEHSRGHRSANEPLHIRNLFAEYFNKEGFVPWQWEAVKKFNI